MGAENSDLELIMSFALRSLSAGSDPARKLRAVREPIHAVTREGP